MAARPDRLSTEIAHILFMDLVGFSQLCMEDQARAVRELRRVVHDAPEFRRASACGELLCLDTGDGMALVFFRDPLAPAQCGLEVARALPRFKGLRLRMGIHSGPVSREQDINGRDNVAGSGINMAQRVMDCGDAGHILVSHSGAEFLGQFAGWSAALHDLGECEVKHGVRLHLYNLVSEQSGNPLRPSRMTIAPAIYTAPDEGTSPDISEALEPAGGAVPLSSRFYVERRTDHLFDAAIARRDSIVLVKGPRQIGKTSLLARGLHRARQSGAAVVSTDLQKLTSAQLSSADTLFFHLAESIVDQLNLDLDLGSVWDGRRSWNVNFERFLRREALEKTSAYLVWALDEVDRLFSCPFGSEVFGLFRSWHNERSLNPDGPWRRLTLAIAYATEAHLFISDLNQSPFNVGTRLSLPDFTEEQVEDLNGRYGAPLHRRGEIERYMSLVGGHPYLVRRGLEEMVTQGLDIRGLEAAACGEDGPFGDHLRRIVLLLAQDPSLAEALRGLLRGQSSADTASFYRLRSAGVVGGEGPREAHVRCRLYREYLERHLL